MNGLMGQYESSNSWRREDDGGSSSKSNDDVKVRIEPISNRFNSGLRQCRKAKTLSSDSDSSDCEVVSSEQWEEAVKRRRPNAELEPNRKRQRAAAAADGCSPSETNVAKKSKVQFGGENVKRSDAKVHFGGENVKRNGVWDDRKPSKRPRTRSYWQNSGQDVIMEDVGAETSSKRPRESPKSGVSPLTKKQKVGDEDGSLFAELEGKRKQRDEHRFVVADAACELQGKRKQKVDDEPSAYEFHQGKRMNKAENDRSESVDVVCEVKKKKMKERVFFEPGDHSVSSDSESQSSKRGPGPSSAERCPKRQKKSLLSNPARTEGRDVATELSELSMNPNNDGFSIREDVKQTTEFKHANEQEWLLRQREIERQAQEAQKLKKRLKAEAERKLEMENRQKQRLAEIRETQKQEQNAMDQKERLRAEVRSRLELMSSTCSSMASLLRKLDIALGAGSPSIQQVNAGYRKALLKFHPDRASQGDLRCQVEAEEKFKLISRMKNVLKPI